MGDNNYSSDELNPPEWLNESFFQNALQKYNKDDTIKVTDLVLRPGTKPGEHYASIMFRAEVTYISKSVKNIVKLILKTMPVEAGPKLDMLKETSAFKTEMRMYEEVLPEMQRILASIGDKTMIAPILVYQSNEPAPVIVFLDEAVNGFKPYENSLTWEEAQAVIERIAKFHACSMYMNENTLDMTTFNECPYEKIEGKIDFLEFFLPSMFEAVDSIKKWEGCDEIAKILEKNLDVVEERIREIFLRPDKQPYQILVHGDFQFKNMISRNGGLKSEDFLLLDFQFCYWNTPAVDVLALIYNVCDKNTRLNHRDEAITKYFRIFQQTLVKLNYKGKIPRLLDLQMEILRCGLLEYMFILVFVPFFSIDFSTLDANDMMEKRNMHEVTKHIFNSKEYKEDFLEQIKRMIAMGILE